MSSSQKRKHKTAVRVTRDTNVNYLPSRAEESVPDPSLFIQAYEADIIRGPQAQAAAKSLEVCEYDSSGESLPVPIIGTGLIKWGGIHQFGAQPAFPEENDKQPTSNDNKGAIWVDRYDARLLLDTLPDVDHRPPPESPTGWSDLPSDAEDTFFFSPEETEDFHREKRRRIIDQNREERLKARRAEDGETEEEEVWGGSDEEPEESQRDLMRKTATHILSSPNPAQLEMRILANYGSDKRFAFLRGRWKREWQIIKGKARIEKEKKPEQTRGLSVLAAYGDSDADSDDDNEGTEHSSANRVLNDNDNRQTGGDANDDIKPDPVFDAQVARRMRAKEWAEKRRSSKDVSV